MQNKLNNYLKKITPTNLEKSKLAQSRQDNLTKPQGSLGLLEEISVKLASIYSSISPKITSKIIFTVAGDHGVTEEGVSAFPQEVTSQMVYNFIQGGAAINVLARQAGAKVIIADIGVASDLKIDDKNFRSMKIAYGTKNMAKEKAMSSDEALLSILHGIDLVENELKTGKIDLLGIGEMGIGNTTPATAIACIVCNRTAEELTGKGTGLDNQGIMRKIEVINKSIQLHNPKPDDALDILSSIGGLEIGAMTGIILAAAANKIPVLIDGVISTSAALLAFIISPLTREYILAAHLSEEKMHSVMLDKLNLKPILNFSMRLGEGTGAALAIPIVEASARILCEMATFSDAAVSTEI